MSTLAAIGGTQVRPCGAKPGGEGYFMLHPPSQLRQGSGCGRSEPILALKHVLGANSLALANHEHDLIPVLPPSPIRPAALATAQHLRASAGPPPCPVASKRSCSVTKHSYIEARVPCCHAVRSKRPGGGDDAGIPR